MSCGGAQDSPNPWPRRHDKEGADAAAHRDRPHSGRWCTVTVHRDPLGEHLLRYESGESALAELTPEVVELLVVALSLRGRSAIPARSPQGVPGVVAMGSHEKDKGKEGDGRWTKPVPPQPDPGKHEKARSGQRGKPDPEERENK